MKMLSVRRDNLLFCPTADVKMNWHGCYKKVNNAKGKKSKKNKKK